MWYRVCLQCRQGLILLSWEDPLEKAGNSHHQVFLPKEVQGQRSPGAAVQRVSKRVGHNRTNKHSQLASCCSLNTLGKFASKASKKYCLLRKISMDSFSINIGISTLKVARNPPRANLNLSYRACMVLFREACLTNPCVLDLFSISNLKQRHLA